MSDEILGQLSDQLSVKKDLSFYQSSYEAPVKAFINPPKTWAISHIFIMTKRVIMPRSASSLGKILMFLITQVAITQAVITQTQSQISPI